MDRPDLFDLVDMSEPTPPSTPTTTSQMASLLQSSQPSPLWQLLSPVRRPGSVVDPSIFRLPASPPPSPPTKVKSMNTTDTHANVLEEEEGEDSTRKIVPNLEVATESVQRPLVDQTAPNLSFLSGDPSVSEPVTSSSTFRSPSPSLPSIRSHPPSLSPAGRRSETLASQPSNSGTVESWVEAKPCNSHKAQEQDGSDPDAPSSLNGNVSVAMNTPSRRFSLPTSNMIDIQPPTSSQLTETAQNEHMLNTDAIRGKVTGTLTAFDSITQLNEAFDRDESVQSGKTREGSVQSDGSDEMEVLARSLSEVSLNEPASEFAPPRLLSPLKVRQDSESFPGVGISEDPTIGNQEVGADHQRPSSPVKLEHFNVEDTLVDLLDDLKERAQIFQDAHLDFAAAFEENLFRLGSLTRSVLINPLHRSFTIQL